jgi:hypothetical protein
MKSQIRQYDCPVCPDTFMQRRLLDDHLSSIHHDVTSPYKCHMCHTGFGSEKAKNVHVKKSQCVSQNGPTTKRRKVAPQSELLLLPFTGTFPSWIEKRYNPSRRTVSEALSASTVDRVVRFRDSMSFQVADDNVCTVDELITIDDEEKLIDLVDNWVDTEVRKYELQTVNNHVRYLHFLLQYFQQCGTENAPHLVEIVDYVCELVHNTQILTSRHTTTISVLKLEDPYSLVRVRDVVVNALLKEQVEYIDPFITSYIQSANSTIETFGLRLRNWIELSIRFTNIPCRIQCTRELCMPSQDGHSYVSKLVEREGQYCRLINQDKTKHSHQPLLLPIGSIISTYLSFYINECRPVANPDHNFVFVTKKGAKWRKPSKDLKMYLEDVLQVPVQTIDPTGRFVHSSRSIGMAAFAIGVQFDQSKMHGFARLMRHSSTTNEQFYSMWQQRHFSNLAVDTFVVAMGLDVSVSSSTKSPDVYRFVQLKRPPPIINRYCQQRMIDTFTAKNVIVPIYSTRSIGTQTGGGDSIIDDSHKCNNTIDVADTVPSCTSCGEMSLCVQGPFGSKRRKKYFGRYFLACTKCHKDRNDVSRFHLPSCLWYPLGYTPLQTTNSSRPRNMAEINQFITDNQ